jgi:hypothetical protein
MTGGVKIPGAVGVLHVTADLRASQIICHVDVDAPRAGRPATRVNWLVRQLKDAPGTLRVEAFLMHARGAGKADLLHQVRSDPTLLITDPTRELRGFRVAQCTAAGSKRGTGRGGFIDSVLSSVDSFYQLVIQNLKPWMPAPPRMRPADEPQPTEPVPTSLVSTAISSQDGPAPDPAVATADGEPDGAAPTEPAPPATPPAEQVPTG